MNRQTSTHLALGTGREFDAIRELLERFGDAARGIGDDGALLRPQPNTHLVISTDTTADYFHFRAGWMSDTQLGFRAAMAALSDLAAMAARADALLVSFVSPQNWDTRLGDVADGIAEAARETGARVVGGNISRGHSFSVTFAVVGYATLPVTRARAQVGDVLLVTGTLGGPAAAVSAWLSGGTPESWALERFLRPRARIDQGLWLAEQGASAMVDISDGLLADAGHIAAASHVDIEIDLAKVPCIANVDPDQALIAGEEYELLISAPQVAATKMVEGFDRRFGIPLTAVGKVVEARGPGIAYVSGRKAGFQLGKDRVEIPRGHDHFSP